jgi:hypothetical protein
MMGRKVLKLFIIFDDEASVAWVIASGQSCPVPYADIGKEETNLLNAIKGGARVAVPQACDAATAARMLVDRKGGSVSPLELLARQGRPTLAPVSMPRAGTVSMPDFNPDQSGPVPPPADGIPPEVLEMAKHSSEGFQRALACRYFMTKNESPLIISKLDLLVRYEDYLDVHSIGQEVFWGCTEIRQAIKSGLLIPATIKEIGIRRKKVEKEEKKRKAESGSDILNQRAEDVAAGMMTSGAGEEQIAEGPLTSDEQAELRGELTSEQKALLHHDS